MTSTRQDHHIDVLDSTMTREFQVSVSPTTAAPPTTLLDHCARPTRVAVVASRPLVAAGLEAVIATEEDVQVVDTLQASPCVVDLRQRLFSCRPHVVIVEVDADSLARGGVDVLTTVHRARDIGVVIVLSDEPSRAVAALKSGARGFLLNDCEPHDIVDAVRQARRGAVPVSPRSLPHLISEVQSPTVRNDLSQRERQVLRLVADGKSNAEIATMLFVAESTVKTHIRRIFRKLAVGDRASAVAVAISSGIIAVNS